MINTTKIYLVTNIDNDPNKVYIGKTINSRRSQHKNKFGSQITYTYIDEIQSLDRKDWKNLESKWIKHYIDLGYNVVNKNKGGNGPEYLNEDARNKISTNKTNKGIKPIVQHDWWAVYEGAENTFIKEWKSIKEASKALNIERSNITACCKKKLKRAGGFVWRYKD
jgi:hypothetical protein